MTGDEVYSRLCEALEQMAADSDLTNINERTDGMAFDVDGFGDRSPGDLRDRLDAAAGLSQSVVDAAHRAEIESATSEIWRLNATLDLVTADRDGLHAAWCDLGARLADCEAALERARGLAVRAVAFDQAGPPEALRSSLSHPDARKGPVTLPTPQRGFESHTGACPHLTTFPVGYGSRRCPDCGVHLPPFWGSQ